MPLAGDSQPGGVDTPYFDSLEELDVWAAAPAKKLEGILSYCSRSPINEPGNRGKLLVKRMPLKLLLVINAEIFVRCATIIRLSNSKFCRQST